MAIIGLDEDKRQIAEEKGRLEMERLSARLKNLFLSQPPEDLLGYFWAQLLMGTMRGPTGDGRTKEKKKPGEGLRDNTRDQLSLTQFILEYPCSTGPMARAPASRASQSKPWLESII
jgi:hypothetical protein